MKMNFISFKDVFPRLFKIVPGLIKGTFYAVTGQTSTAKTKFAKFLFVNHAYNYCKANDIPLKILYFALEESVDKFWVTIKCDLLFERYGEVVTYYQVEGFHEGLTSEIQQHLDEIEPEIQEMKKCIEVVDFIYNPTGLLKKVKEVMLNYGKIVNEKEDKDELGNKYKSFDYKYDNPDTHVIVVVDHVGNLSPEKNPFSDVSSLHLAISKWSEYVIKYITKKYKCIVCNVHQQAMSGDNESNVQQNPDLLLPALSKFGDNLISVREYEVIFGLFNPSRYKAFATKYKGYDMNILNNKFRHLCLLKHRSGQDNITLPLLFNGKINYFEELPLAEDIPAINKVYSKLGDEKFVPKAKLSFNGLNS